MKSRCLLTQTQGDEAFSLTLPLLQGNILSMELSTFTAKAGEPKWAGAERGHECTLPHDLTRTEDHFNTSVLHVRAPGRVVFLIPYLLQNAKNL